MIVVVPGADAPRGPTIARGTRAGPGDDEPTPIGDPDDDWEDDDEDEDEDEDDDEEPLQAKPGPLLADGSPRPPSGPGDVDGDELPMGDPPDDDPTDDPNDEDEGEGDDEPLHGARPPAVPGARLARQLQPRKRYTISRIGIGTPSSHASA